jgi:hypothetical protein
MTLSSQKPHRRTSDDYEARRARHFGLRAVARALDVRDFVELRRPRRAKRQSTSAGGQPTRPSRQLATALRGDASAPGRAD